MACKLKACLAMMALERDFARHRPDLFTLAHPDRIGIIDSMSNSGSFTSNVIDRDPTMRPGWFELPGDLPVSLLKATMLYLSQLVLIAVSEFGHLGSYCRNQYGLDTDCMFLSAWRAPVRG